MLYLLSGFLTMLLVVACQSKSTNVDKSPSNVAPVANTTTTTGSGNNPASSTTTAANLSPDTNIIGPVPVPICAKGVPIDVNVVVTTAVGPNGFNAPIVVSNDLYSMGIDDRTRQDYVPNLDPKFVAYLQALHPGHLRFPAGHNGQTYTWATTGNSLSLMTPELVDQFMALVQAVNSNAYFGINIESGTINDATNFITYVNKTKNYGVKWWQIGNEPTLPGLFSEYTTGDRLNPNFAVYIQKYLTYRQALLAVDPTIKTVGVEAYTGVDVGPTPNNYGEPDWLTPFLAGVGHNNVDAIAFHYYPLYSGDGSGSGTNTANSTYPSVAHLLQEDASDWPPAGLDYPNQVLPYMLGKMAAVAPNAQVWVDEFAEDSGNNLAATGYGDTFVGALWAADSIGRYADQGVGAIFHFIFKAYQPASGIDFGYTLLDPNNDPRPEYYTLWLMANHFGDRMVATNTSAITQVSSHAAIRSADGSLRVMLINKMTTAQAVRLQLSDFKPVRAIQYNLIGNAIQGTNVTINGSTLSQAVVANGQTAVAAVAAQACTDNTVTLAPLSINMLVFTNKP